MLKIISVRECHIFLGLALISVLCTAAHPALAIPYHVEVFVRSGDNVGGVEIISPNSPSLNNNGDIAFGASFIDPTTGSFQQRIFINDQLQVQPGINIIIGGVIIFVGDLEITSAFSPSLNNNGDVAFRAFFIDSTNGSSERGIFVNYQLRVQSGDNFGGVDITSLGFKSPSLNDNGDLTFSAFFRDPTTGDFTSGIFVNDQLRVQSGDNASGVDIGFRSDPSLNNNGDLAFGTSFRDPTTGVFISALFFNDQQQAKTGDNIDGFDVIFLGYPSLNDNGDVAFEATFTDPTTGNFTRGIFVNDQLLIQHGDIIGGLDIISPHSPSLNNNGDVAFVARFRDPTTGFSTTGIFVARPIPVVNPIPEPLTATLGLMGLGVLGMATRRRVA